MNVLFYSVLLYIDRQKIFSQPKPELFLTSSWQNKTAKKDKIGWIVF